jgi:hypothetical protein
MMRAGRTLFESPRLPLSESFGVRVKNGRPVSQFVVLEYNFSIY